VKVDLNIVVVAAVIAVTVLLMFVSVPAGSLDLFKLGFTALISWGAGFALGSTNKADTSATPPAATQEPASPN